MNLEKVCKQISNDTGFDYDIVREIVSYEFKYTVDIMKDPDDYRDILFNKLFKFKLKNRFKEDKSKNYSPNEKVSLMRNTIVPI